MGYYRAGFEVVGVDIKPQKHYPFEFHQADALAYPLDGFDVIHASPPCQAYSVTKSLHKRNYPDLISTVRQLLFENHKPYVIENVYGAPLFCPTMLCGSMFDGLRVYRHRYFEIFPRPFMSPACCNHSFKMPKSKGEYHTLKKQMFITCVGHNFQLESGRIAMGIPWMTIDELSQAIPPAYTEYIGKQLIRYLETRRGK